MSWKWVVDRRSGKIQVDRRALAGAVVGGIVLAVLAGAVLPAGLFYAAVAMLTVAGIGIDVWIRQRDPEGPSTAPADAEGGADGG